MRFALKPHPNAPPGVAVDVQVELSNLGAGKLGLRYEMLGEIDRLRFPQAAARERRDGLWQHSCFEIFIRPGRTERYFEFNFSPSGEWAGYSFPAHRSGRSSPPDLVAPVIETRREANAFELQTMLDLASLKELAAAPMWEVGLSVIVEEASGDKSYWALAHPPGDPDFHHSDCFAIELAAPNAP
jgi:hypothetical protein